MAEFLVWSKKYFTNFGLNSLNSLEILIEGEFQNLRLIDGHFRRFLAIYDLAYKFFAY